MMKNHIHKIYVRPLLILMIMSLPLLALQEAAVSVENVSGEVYCVYGQGGNIGLLMGEDGLLLVDSQFAQNAGKVLEAIQKLKAQKIIYLINTHYHGDHTDGNAMLGKGAKIISHKNCRLSFLKGLKPEESPESRGSPQLTYEKAMTLQVDDESIQLLHFGPGHTSGDTVVVFTKTKVIHAGDLFFNGMPPYIDVKDGSDTKNWIKTIIELAERYPDYKVIPGHGKVTDMKNYLKFADYLRYLREQVAEAIRAGKTREQAMKSIDLSPVDHIQDQGEFLTKKQNIGWIYDEMTRK